MPAKFDLWAWCTGDQGQIVLVVMDVDSNIGYSSVVVGDLHCANEQSNSVTRWCDLIPFVTYFSAIIVLISNHCHFTLGQSWATFESYRSSPKCQHV